MIPEKDNILEMGSVLKSHDEHAKIMNDELGIIAYRVTDLEGDMKCLRKDVLEIKTDLQNHITNYRIAHTSLENKVDGMIQTHSDDEKTKKSLMYTVLGGVLIGILMQIVSWIAGVLR